MQWHRFGHLAAPVPPLKSAQFSALKKLAFFLPTGGMCDPIRADEGCVKVITGFPTSWRAASALLSGASYPPRRGPAPQRSGGGRREPRNNRSSGG